MRRTADTAHVGDDGPDRAAPAGAVERLSDWWHRESAALAGHRGPVADVVRVLATRPAAVLLPLAAIGPGLFGAAIPDGDAAWFRDAGRSMLSSEVLDVFADPGLQIGPLYLLVVGLLTVATQALGLPVLFTVAAVQSTALAGYALYLSGAWARELGADPLRARWGVVTPLVVLGPLAESIGNGHPEELLLGLMLGHLVLLVRGGRADAAGLMLGLMVGLKLWGVLAAPVVLLARRWRAVVVAGAWTVVLAAVLYAPFFLWGEVNTFDFSWGRGLAPFGVELSGALLEGWGFRVLQAGLVVLLAALVAWRRPGTGLGVALTVVTVRIVLDPLLQMYYTIPAVVLGLLFAWTAPAATRRWAAWSWPLVACAMLVPYLLDRAPRVALTHTALVVLTVAVVRRDRSRAADHLVDGGAAAGVDQAGPVGGFDQVR